MTLGLVHLGYSLPEGQAGNYTSLYPVLFEKRTLFSHKVGLLSPYEQILVPQIKLSPLLCLSANQRQIKYFLSSTKRIL